MVGNVIDLYVEIYTSGIYNPRPTSTGLAFMLEYKVSPTGQMWHINIEVDGRTNWPPIPYRILVSFSFSRTRDYGRKVNYCNIRPWLQWFIITCVQRGVVIIRLFLFQNTYNKHPRVRRGVWSMFFIRHTVPVFNELVSQIAQLIKQISHIAPFCNRNINTCAYFFWNWCNVECGNGWLWERDGWTCCNGR